MATETETETRKMGFETDILGHIGTLTYCWLEAKKPKYGAPDGYVPVMWRSLPLTSCLCRTQRVSECLIHVLRL
jgi:hypothetical protein